MATTKTSKTTTAKGTTKGTVNEAVQTTLKVNETKNGTATDKKTETTAVETKPATKTPAKKTPAKKTTTRNTTAKKVAAKKEADTVKADIFVQFQGMEFSEKDIMDKVVAAWEAEGKKASAIKKAKLYVKPEDGKAYYVINEGLKNGSTGAVVL